MSRLYRKWLDPRTQNALGGFFIGLTMFVLIAWFLQQIGFLYVHTQSSGFQQLKIVNDSMVEVRPTVRKAISQLRVAEAELLEALSAGNAPWRAQATKRYVNIREAFPDLFDRIASEMPRNSAILFRLSPDQRDGYKIVMHSEICSAVALENPKLVDPTLDFYGTFCRYFGFWNPAGQHL